MIILKGLGNQEGHRFYDRGMSYKVAKILEDWYQKEVEANGI